MFDIPMNTKGAMDSSGLLALNNGGGMQSAPNAGQPQGDMNDPNLGGQYTQQPQQQAYQQPQQQAYQQPVQQQTYQQPVQQQTYQQPQQQAYQQPVQQQNMQASVPKQRPQGNGVRLKKGQKVALAQNGQQLGVIQVCLGWDVANVACDLDASAFMLDQNSKVVGDDWFVFYNQPSSPDGSVTHSGDSQGAAYGDDEIITIDTQRVNTSVQKIAFVVTINEAMEQGLNFSMVQNAYVRVVDKATGNEMAKFQLTEYYSNVTSMVVGELYRYNGSWKFNAIGDGVARDLMGLCSMYGVNVAD